MERQILCSIVILSYNQLEYTKNCLESIKKYTDVPYEIIVVDNASSEPGCVEYLESRKDIIFIKNNENRGFAGGCNQGIKISKGKYIMLLNNDTIVTKHWLSNMVDLLEKNKNIAMTGPLTNATVGKQMIHTEYGSDMEKMQEFANHISKSDNMPWRTLRLVFFCVLIRREIFDEIGLLDENFAVGNYEDDDFNLRVLMAKKEMYICRNSFIHHFMNVSFKHKNVEREKIMMINKKLLEDKWDNLNWNHHAVYNSYMLNEIIKQQGKKICHIGCGIGSLGIELKDRDRSYEIIGVEWHPIRRKIADIFLDKVYELDDNMKFFDNLKDKLYDVVVVECSIEILGMGIMEQIKKLLQKNARVFLRVFNYRHITSIEKAVTGKVEGDLLCAVSPEFRYYFDDSIDSQLKKMGYSIIEEKKICKTLSSVQEELLNSISGYNEYKNEAVVYNRIYKLQIEE